MKISQEVKDLMYATNEYFLKRQKMKMLQTKLEVEKQKFYALCDSYFDKHEVQEFEFCRNTIQDEILKVSKVQKVSITFNPKKVEKSLGKQLSQEVIHKKYYVNDMAGLISYLKECKVDPEIFKSFIEVESSVDSKELDRLEEIGKVNAEQLKGCYTVKKQKPFYSIRKGTGE